MTPDLLHYTLLVASCLALPVLLAAAVLLHRHFRSAGSLCLLCGLAAIAIGSLVQAGSPVGDITLDEFRGVLVSSGRFPLRWYAGSVISAAGLLIASGGALALALRLRSPGGAAVGRRSD